MIRRISSKPKKRISNFFIHILLLILSVIWLIPVIWIVIQSFREEEGAYVSTFFPKNYTWNNYVRLFTETDVLNFPRMFINTLMVAILTCFISTIFVLSVAYCMSRLRFKLRKAYMNLSMIISLFPGFMSMIAVYYILKALHLSEGRMILLALVIVYSAGSGITFYVAKGFFDTIPKALDEAAILDGCTKFQVFSKIIVPLSKPAIVYTVLNSFMAPWLDFIFAKVICRAEADYYTVSIGLWRMLELENIYDWFTRFAAAAVLISIPIAILFMLMQRFYSEEMSGSVKG